MARFEALEECLSVHNQEIDQVLREARTGSDQKKMIPYIPIKNISKKEASPKSNDHKTF